jgi:hypothetical protein
VQHPISLDNLYFTLKLDNSITFKGKPIGPEKFLNRMVEALYLIIDRHR